MKKFDAVIIGSGQGGTPLAKKLAQAGWKTALIEKRFIGGTCINDGCTPTKALIASARMAWLTTQAKKLGVEISGEVKVDMDAIVNRKNEIVESFRNGSQEGLEKAKNLTLLFGTASFLSDHTLSVTHNDTGDIEKFEAKYIFINTGTYAALPPVAGIRDVPYLTNTSILELREVPKHLLIIGGSYVGLEFGQMFKRLGSRVTILETANRFLVKEDRDIADNMLEILEAEGLKILINAKAKSVSKSANSIEILVDEGGKEKTISCSHILLAAGRPPQTSDLQLQNTGIKTDEKGFITVNSKLETSVENIYALGDVKGGPAFTHISYNDHLIIYHNLLKKGRETVTNRLVPYCMFTDPQLGRVGTTEEQAKQDGRKIKVATLPMKNVARAIETGDTRGMMKAIIDTETDLIIGVAIIGEQGGEIMSVLQMAMIGKVPYTVIRNTAIAHPLYAESLNNLFMNLD